MGINQAVFIVPDFSYSRRCLSDCGACGNHHRYGFDVESPFVQRRGDVGFGSDGSSTYI